MHILFRFHVYYWFDYLPVFLQMYFDYVSGVVSIHVSQMIFQLLDWSIHDLKYLQYLHGGVNLHIEGVNHDVHAELTGEHTPVIPGFHLWIKKEEQVTLHEKRKLVLPEGAVVREIVCGFGAAAWYGTGVAVVT